MSEENAVTLPSRGCRRWGVDAVRIGTFAYAASILALILLFRFAGEKWWVTAVLVYVPPHLWLLPLLPLTVLTLLFERRFLVRLAGCLVLALFGLCRFQVSLPASSKEGAPVLKIVTNNIGESNGTSVHDFVLRERPDLIVMQDAKRFSLKEVQQLYPPPEWHIKREGTHVLVSRFPIRSSRLLPKQWRRSPAAVFSIDWEGRHFSLYSVHLPTPRTEFRHLVGRQRGRHDPTDPIQSLGQIEGFQSAMQSRVREAARLAELIAASPEPVLLVGDFNMPRWGYLYTHFGSRFTDAFDSRGFGTGFTVSGEAGSPLLLLGPWVRLDYLFCSPSWRPLSCSVEPRRKSQHRAVMATFEWQPRNP